MKLHSHKFFHHFNDGNRVILKVTRGNIVKLRWKRRPKIAILDEYRLWRSKVIQILYPGKCVMVVE